MTQYVAINDQLLSYERLTIERYRRLRVSRTTLHAEY